MKSINAGRIFGIGAILVIGSFYLNSRLSTGSQLSSDQLSAIYTGLGFVGLLATFWHEKEQAMEGDAEHAKLISAMKSQTMASHRATMFHAKVFRLERVLSRLKEMKEQQLGTRDAIMEGDRLRIEAAKLQGELDRFSDTMPE